MQTFRLPGVPADFSLQGEPDGWRLEPDGALFVRSGPKTDVFNDPAAGTRIATAPCARMATSDACFVLSAHVAVTARATFDAGVIFVRTSDEQWAKFCVEQSPVAPDRPAMA